MGRTEVGVEHRWAARGDVEAQLWRAVGAFRIAMLIYAGLLVTLQRKDYGRPGLALAIVSGMAVWTAAVTLAYRRPRLRSTPVLVADLAVAVVALVATLPVQTYQRVDQGAPTVPVSWVAAPVMAWAIRRGPLPGVFAAVVIGAGNLTVRRGHPSVLMVNNIVLLALLGLILGYAARLARQAEQRLAHSVQLSAATAERDRIAREVHDSVLQVLALVARDSGGLEGEAARLGRLAGEQEQVLRSLIQREAPPVDGTDLDLRQLLPISAAVTVSAPAEPVLLPAHVAKEVAAAVQAAVCNVAEHAGAGAQAWVLIDDRGPQVAITVRDDGAGLPPGRLAAAAGEGRLGVSQSIIGRVVDLGGTATVTSWPGEGTEVLLVVPRDPGGSTSRPAQLQHAGGGSVRHG